MPHNFFIYLSFSLNFVCVPCGSGGDDDDSDSSGETQLFLEKCYIVLVKLVSQTLFHSVLFGQIVNLNLLLWWTVVDAVS